jgi:hypothetical protein
VLREIGEGEGDIEVGIETCLVKGRKNHNESKWTVENDVWERVRAVYPVPASADMKIACFGRQVHDIGQLQLSWGIYPPVRSGIAPVGITPLSAIMLLSFKIFPTTTSSTQLLFVLAIRAAGDDETPLNFLVPKSRARYRPCAGHPKR